MKILILCTGNSCRSQMAEAILQSFDSKLEVHSSGTKPSSRVHPNAIKVTAELGLDISQYKPKLLCYNMHSPFFLYNNYKDLYLRKDKSKSKQS